jgi:hypothetical protein
VNITDMLEELGDELADCPAPEVLDRLREIIPELGELCRHKWLLRLLLQLCE